MSEPPAEHPRALLVDDVSARRRTLRSVRRRARWSEVLLGAVLAVGTALFVRGLVVGGFTRSMLGPGAWAIALGPALLAWAIGRGTAAAAWSRRLLAARRAVIDAEGRLHGHDASTRPA